jgi:hypothetical protein
MARKHAFFRSKADQTYPSKAPPGGKTWGWILNLRPLLSVDENCTLVKIVALRDLRGAPMYKREHRRSQIAGCGCGFELQLFLLIMVQLHATLILLRIKLALESVVVLRGS